MVSHWRDPAILPPPPSPTVETPRCLPHILSISGGVRQARNPPSSVGRFPVAPTARSGKCPGREKRIVQVNVNAIHPRRPGITVRRCHHRMGRQTETPPG
ncbi:hypothetical protein KCP71_01770 [Salmonella enterica subsp. enterica]|nr:hypothetical protein KCP71_01770 [Salmonella enterica subsp. enterica]